MNEESERIETERKERDLLYRMMERREQPWLLAQVIEIRKYLKQIYGERFEQFATYIGDRNQRCPQDNLELIAILDKVIDERRQDVLLLTFFLFLSFLRDIQDVIARSVIHEESYRDWLRLLHERSRCFLGGTGEPLADFLQTTCLQYVIRTPLLLGTTAYREQAAIESHSE